MSAFQPINKARRTSKPAAENNSPVSIVSPTYEHESLRAIVACPSYLMRASSSQAKPSKTKKRKSPMVVVSAKAPPQALVSAEDSNDPQTPLRKKRKTVNENPKFPPERAPRNAKVVPTVEHSTNSTPATDAESDSDWSNSSERLEKLDSNMNSQTPHRRNPRQRPSSRISAGFSSTGQCIGSSPSTRPKRPPLDEVSGNAVKRDCTASRDRYVIRPRSLSPSNYNKKNRARKLQADGLVELPSAEWAYQRYRRTKKESEKKVQAERRSWRKEWRKQKGKEPERRLEGNAGTTSEMPSKKRVKADRETAKARKRQEKSHKRAKEESMEVDADLQHVQNTATRSEQSSVDSRKNQSGKAESSRKKSKVIIHEDSQPEAVVLQTTSDDLSSDGKRSAPNSYDKGVPLQRSTASECIPTGPKLWRRNQTQISRPWQQTCNRREVEVAAGPGRCECKCENLPAYFKQPDLLEPSLADFEGEKAEFLSHLRHVGDCKGHNQRLIDSCRFILIQEQRNEWRRAQSSSAPSNKENEIMPRGRQQSSIGPDSFYGKQPQYRIPPIFDSSPFPDKGLTNENKHRDAGRSETANDMMTPPESSPGRKGSHNRRKSTGAHMPLEPNVNDNDPIFPTPKSSLRNRDPGSADSVDNQSALTSPSQDSRGVMDVRTKSQRKPLDKDRTVPEEKVVERINKEFREQSKGRPQPGISFNLQRRRYKSVPASSISRTATLNKPNASPQPTQSHRDHALQELSQNAILHKLASVEKVLLEQKVLLERLPAMPMIQNASDRPAPAVTAAAAVGNEDERPQQRRRKRVSDAERQLQRPKFDRQVPEHLRLPDEDIVNIGRTLSRYERHVQAPYAFSWRGVVYAPYKHLFS